MVIIIITTKSTTRQPSLSIDVEEENVDIDDLVEDEDEKACSKGGRDIHRRLDALRFVCFLFDAARHHLILTAGSLSYPNLVPA